MAYSFRRRFEFGLAWRTLFLVGAISLLALAIWTPDIRAGRIVAALIAAAALATLWNFIRRTNFQIARFIESIRFQDYSQRFSDPSGAGFDVLGDTLDRAIKELQSRQHSAAAEARALAAIVDDAPSALVAVDAIGRVEMLNKAARQLFARDPVHQLSDLDRFGPEFAAVSKLPPGSRKITRLTVDGVTQRALFASSQVARLDAEFTILSIFPMQSELGALEVAAQADLVRVLTHEIMNSLTPVTSLARTSAELVAAGGDMEAAKLATETVARRSEGILRFVESYREFAQSPQVRRRKFAVKPWADEILRLAAASADGTALQTRLEVTPDTLKVDADPELLAQALLNLLRNAVRATAGAREPLVRLSISRQRGAQCRIEVADNGPGIAADRREDIFLPFYTTHKGGSGVGLSFARQVVLAHGGSISADEAPEGGAGLTITI
jgi:signal transduction histidine kinase